MPVVSSAVDPIRIRAMSGCGTLHSPWTGWEDQIEDGPPSHTYQFVPGFYAASHPVRLGSGTVLEPRPGQPGRAWFLPRRESTDPFEALFVVDGAHGIALRGLCFNGGGDGARHGLLVRCATGLQIEGCRFGDFGAQDGSAIRIEGEGEHRHVREVVIQASRFINDRCGVRLGPWASDLLIADNRFEEVWGPALLVDPRDHRSDYGLIFVKNHLRAARPGREGPFIRILAGAEGIRVAENTIDGAAASPALGPRAAREVSPGIEVRGEGRQGVRRLEIILNQIRGTTGPGLAALRCDAGLLAAGNHLTACGSAQLGGVDLVSCHGALVEDNEIREQPGPGIRLQDCSSSRLNGNEICGGSDSPVRGGTVGLLVGGSTTRRVRVTDNRISGVREEGVRVSSSLGLRLVGNEVQDCGHGIRIAAATNLLLVGNDCRDNGRGGIQVDPPVHRGLVALNYAILNGVMDLEVRGHRIRCRDNKVDKQGSQPEPAISEG